MTSIVPRMRAMIKFISKSPGRLSGEWRNGILLVFQQPDLPAFAYVRKARTLDFDRRASEVQRMEEMLERRSSTC